MKFPSIKSLLQSVETVLSRFPFEMLFAFTGSITAITYVELSNTNPRAEMWCLRVLMMANLGLLVSLATSLYCESRQIQKPTRFIIKLIAAAIGVCFIFLLNPLEHYADHIRFFLLSLGLHLLVSFAAFLKPGSILGFWRFNAILFFRFLTSALYSVVLFGGIAAALGAMNFLFNFKFEWDSFAVLWICIVGLFNTLFFLAGVPADLLHLEEEFTYPAGIKIFTQYVLIPLATIYVLILLSYEIKILIEWNLPKGLVSNLILGYAVFGILALLLVYPVREQAENKWIKTYARSFYFLMLPLIVLLLLAVGTRISRYGITEFRYFLILLACWLTFITIYFLVSRKQNIKLIPMTLCVLTLLSIYGPQGAFSVSKYSQRRVLISIFNRNHAFADDKLIPVDSNKISRKDGNRAVATLTYLVTHYDVTSLQPYLKKDLDAVGDSLGKQKNKWMNGLPVSKDQLRYEKLDWIKRYLGLNKFSGYDADIDYEPESDNFYFKSKEMEVVDVKGYDLYLDNTNAVGTDTITVQNGGLTITKITRKNGLFQLKLNEETATFDVKQLVTSLFNDKTKLQVYTDTTKQKNDFNRMHEHHYQFPKSVLSITQSTPGYTITLEILNAQFSLEKTKSAKPEPTYINAVYLIKKK